MRDTDAVNRSAQWIATGWIVAVAMVLGACGEENAPPPRFPFTFTANADGDPLAGVTILVNDNPLGETSDEGVLSTALTGPEGAPIVVSAQCPEGHRSSTEPQMSTLRRITSIDPAISNEGIQLTFDCPPELRDAVVVVRTGDWSGLPIYLDGREVTRTDANGTAHVAVRMTPNTSFEVRIAANLVNERLRPQGHSRSFDVRDLDEIFVYEQDFEEEAPRRRRRIRRPTPPPTRRLPIRHRALIDGRPWFAVVVRLT